MWLSSLWRVLFLLHFPASTFSSAAATVAAAAAHAAATAYAAPTHCSPSIAIPPPRLAAAANAIATAASV